MSSPDWPDPNLGMLNNALAQTGLDRPRLTRESWREILRSHLKEISWKQARADVEPFLESEQEGTLLTSENLEKLLGKR